MKKLLCVAALLVLLTSCGNKDNENDNLDTPNMGGQQEQNNNNTGGDLNNVTDGSGTVVDINGVDQDQILEDLDNLLKEIIDSAENDEGTMSGTTASGAAM